ncbi:MAG: M24 family metallopeptidase, partial [Candidatus Sumerlaeota bacterium]|nr:M24 family metallopeptidase [Candidatus Sumerlaeota bacterium]
MLTAEGCRARRARLMERLGPEAALVLIHSATHIYYLTGYLPSVHSLNWDARNWLLLRPDGDSVLLVDNRQSGAARQASVDRVEILKWHGIALPPPANRARSMNEFLGRTLRGERIGAGALACEMERFPMPAADALAGAGLPRPTLDATPVLEQMRRAKDPDELDVIGRNIAVTEAIHAASREIVEPGMTEWDVYRALHNVALEAAGDELVMRCDVTGSPRPNREPRFGMTLDSGSLVILDMFPMFLGYRSDITNTLAVGGRPSARQRELLALCEKAMAAGQRALRPGVRGCDVYSAVRAAFA